MHKFGFLRGDEDLPFEYSDCWHREQTSGPERLVIGRARGHVATVQELASLWSAECWLLYVLVVPRSAGEAGRYQSPSPVNQTELRAFLERFGAFLEADGRHHLWVASSAGEGTLVYDRHNVIYAYGDLSAHARTLERLGCREDSVEIPVPHTHHYRAECDGDQEDVVSYWAWRHSPLQEQDLP